MKKIKNFKFGGIQQKVFGLVIATIVLLVAAFAAVIIYQSNNLTNVVRDTSASQEQSITSISEETMLSVLDTNLTQSTQMQAYIAGDLFGEAVRVVNVVADYTGKLLADPEDYPVRAYALPDKAKNGEISVQVLTEAGIDLTDPVISSKLGLIANLSDLMIAIYADSNVDSCYVALPDGVMLLVDNHSASKFDENGGIVPIPIRERLWYMGAIETGKLHFTDVTTDLFTGEISIMCSLPVYVDGQIVAVIGADLFLNDVSATVNRTARDGSFICIVNQNGHVLFSPQTEGVFRVLPAEEARDLRLSENEQFGQFVRDALTKNTEMRLIEVDHEPCYLVGAPIGNVGWAVISVYSKSLADQPSTTMLKRFNAIQNLATDTFNRGMNNAKLTILVLVAVIVLLAVAAATLLSKRIVKPLKAMTDKVRSLGGDDLQFRMEDAYRTHDEIEVLAESFSMLSGKTLEYISQIERVTAEKERIGAELSLATRIQADMLPNVFPPFPGKEDFDIYASMKPAKEVGGDFYDFFLVDDDHLCMVIADVSGKGVPAALFMMASKIILANNAMMGKSPAQILTDTNAAICKNNREEMFVTVWLGILDLQTGVLTTANAGHEYPVLKNANGSFELIKGKHGLPIGGMESAQYKESTLKLEKGSKLFVYTDGVVEATDAALELFGTDRMVEALRSAENQTPKDILEAINRAVGDFVKDAPQFDDLTMLCLEYNGVNESKNTEEPHE